MARDVAKRLPKMLVSPLGRSPERDATKSNENAASAMITGTESVFVLLSHCR